MKIHFFTRPSILLTTVFKSAAVLSVLLCHSPVATAEAVHAIAMHGKPALPENFNHFPYANPDAPKGGVYHEAITGSFDSLNPFIIKGQAAFGLGRYAFESLMARNLAEPFSLYGLIAEKVDVTPQRNKITFYLNPAAKFSDGSAITAQDVLFSWQTLRDQGRPNHRSYYKKVTKAFAPDEHTVVFELTGDDRELVMILGLMPVLSKTWFASHKFESTTLKPILSSGPYIITKVKPGKQLIYQRNPNYWGKDLPSNRGRWNPDQIKIDYYRDNQTAFEAFKKGLADLRIEDNPTRWSTGYDFPAMRDGRIIKETVKMGLPAPLSALVMNSRRDIFADPRTRLAMLYALDFEWLNSNLFHNLYQRTQSYFDQSELGSNGIAASPHERELLAKHGVKLPAAILDGSFHQPLSDGSGRDRKNLHIAFNYLKQAGWVRKGNILVNNKTGREFRIEMIVKSREHERIGLSYKRTLANLGIELNIRQIDSAQFQRRLQTYDFDLVPFTYYNSLSPGNEQQFYWGSYGRKQDGTRNYMGAENPAIDAMIEEVLAARDRPDFVDAVRALDRILVSGTYLVPLFHSPGQWVAHWQRVKFPKTPSLYGFRSDTLWIDQK